MGGDEAPRMVIEGANIARRQYRQAHFLFFGDKAQIEPLLKEFPKLETISEIRHTDEMVVNEDKPSIALRQRRNSSMRLAINAVKDGEAQCVISAGNTGALMAMAKFVFKVLPGISRPAIAGYLPTLKEGRDTVLLDMGANIQCDANNLSEFAVLGAVYSKEVLGVNEPAIGLLNVGEEEMKGNEQVKEAATLLSEHKNLPGKFVGFVEGNDITSGAVDVTVTDGFTGNIALKSIEGSAKLVSTMLKRALKSSLLAKLGLIFMWPALMGLKKRMDPSRYNGGIFMGLRGICIKSHGGANNIGFASAIGVGADIALSDFNEKVARELEKLHEAQELEKIEDLSVEAV